MKFDLHFHTTLSDGLRTPEETIEIAKERGLQFVCCTDHDLVNTEVPELARAVGIEAIEWVELSSADYTNNAKSVHLTCYSWKFQGRIFEILEGVQSARRQKILLQIEKLQGNGFHIPEEHFFSYWEKLGASLVNLNNGHLSQYLLDNPDNVTLAQEIMGDAYDKRTFMKQVLSRAGDFAHIGSIDGFPAYEPSVELCGELARENNAVLSIAHPNHTFKSIEEFATLAPGYIERGINALEIHISTPSDWIKTIFEIRERFNLLLTFWSDCHFDRRDDKHGMIGELNPHLDPQFIEQEFQKFKRAL